MGVGRIFFGLALPSVQLLACNALSGVGELYVPGGDEVDAASHTPTDAAIRGDAAPGDATSDVPSETAAPPPPPTCTCVAPPPAGWTGPVTLIERNDDQAISCPPGLKRVMGGGSDPAIPSPG